MMKMMNKLLHTGMIVFLLMSCGDGAGNNPDDDAGYNPGNGSAVEWGNPIPFQTPPQGKGIYTAGYYSSYSTDRETRACYWKTVDNITVQKDLEATLHAQANAIFVTGNGVYAAGVFVSGAKRNPCYWLDNGTTVARYILEEPNGDGHTYMKAIMVTENDVYAAGYYDKSDFAACYWDASRACHDLPLPSGATRSYALSMGVTPDGIIYIAGYYRNSNDNFQACYWKVSGTSIERKDIDSERRSFALDMAVTSTGVFIAGSYENYANWSYPCYWTVKGDKITRHDLKGNGSAEQITVNAAGPYTAGHYNANLCYWDASSDEPHRLAGNITYSAKGIVVSSTGNIFVAGLYDTEQDWYPNACYWDNRGVRHDFISDDFYASNSYLKSYAESMILVE
jgi:hypothetical protein